MSQIYNSCPAFLETHLQIQKSFSAKKITNKSATKKNRKNSFFSNLYTEKYTFQALTRKTFFPASNPAHSFRQKRARSVDSHKKKVTEQAILMKHRLCSTLDKTLQKRIFFLKKKTFILLLELFWVQIISQYLGSPKTCLFFPTKKSPH